MTPVLQVLLSLRFYATGTFQDVVAEMIGVHQSTASRTIARVTEAILRRLPQEIRMPASQREADDIKAKFYRMNPGFPNTIGCIDGTHVRIQAPTEAEHEYVNRKNFHSINVQVMCDANLLFINVIAKWPGSVHDARILRESALFTAFESPRKPLKGLILGDSRYMLRDWLMTPILNPATQSKRNYNFAHSSTRTTIERCIRVAKRRWHCLRCGLRLEPPRACQVITVCLWLHNLGLDPPDSDDDDMILIMTMKVKMTTMPTTQLSIRMH